MKSKKCNICGINKKISEYPRDKTLKTGYRGQCKKCGNLACRVYYAKNKKQILKVRKKYNSLETTKERNRKYINNKRKKDIHYKIKDNLRRRINYAITNGKKATNTTDLLGCSLEEFRIYIENLWLDGMSWKNYGMFGWHLDHIIPCASFDLSDPEQQKKCFHYSNVQPLWAKDNWSKGAR
ncbi:hypothetical protein EBQ81_01710 [bacterium]|nr:hypothetical protein [bacterium]